MSFMIHHLQRRLDVLFVSLLLGLSRLADGAPDAEVGVHEPSGWNGL